MRNIAAEMDDYILIKGYRKKKAEDEEEDPNAQLPLERKDCTVGKRDHVSPKFKSLTMEQNKIQTLQLKKLSTV